MEVYGNFHTFIYAVVATNKRLTFRVWTLQGGGAFAVIAFPLINEVTGPRYALHCFATHVETRSAPEKKIDYPIDGLLQREINPRRLTLVLDTLGAELGRHHKKTPRIHTFLSLIHISEPTRRS